MSLSEMGKETDGGCSGTLKDELNNVIPFAYLEFPFAGVNEEDTNLTSGVRVKDSGSNINAMMGGGIGVGSDAAVHARRN